VSARALKVMMLPNAHSRGALHAGTEVLRQAAKRGTQRATTVPLTAHSCCSCTEAGASIRRVSPTSWQLAWSGALLPQGSHQPTEGAGQQPCAAARQFLNPQFKRLLLHLAAGQVASNVCGCWPGRAPPARAPSLLASKLSCFTTASNALFRVRASFF